MARSKGKTGTARATGKPTIEQIKAQPGKHLFVTYEGLEGGGWFLPALRPRFAGDITEEMTITPFKPRMISEDWLDNTAFVLLYNRVPGIKVWKSDSLPEEPDMMIPPDLANLVPHARQQFAYHMALSPFDDKFRDVCNVTNDSLLSEEEEIEWEKKELAPFLIVLRFYESKFMNRPEVIRFLNRRIEAIKRRKGVLDEMKY